jgi:hypothetical protein
MYQICTPGIIGPIMFLAGLTMSDRCEAFVTRLKTGTEQKSDDPDYLLREKLMRLREMARADRRNPRRTIRPNEGIPWVISAWNGFAAYRTMVRLQPIRDVQTPIIGAPTDWREKLWEGIPY